MRISGEAFRARRVRRAGKMRGAEYRFHKYSTNRIML